MPFLPIGSVWGKWDLHFHTPSSFDYENRAISNQQIVDGLKAAGVVAVAITDHHFIDADRIRALQDLAGDELTIFPGIELRTELGGKQGVHLIGIFPETKDVAFIWSKIQGPLAITRTEVESKGNDRVYVKFEDAAKLIHDLGGMVSVHVGGKSNSIENIGNEHAYKRAFKEDLARHHIDLFEIGQLGDAREYREIVFAKIGFERPLVICSDNHNILNYAVKTPCWIKADPAFKAFQQIISDPLERVYVGELPPSVDRVRKNSTKYLKSISFKKLPHSGLDEDWFSGTVSFNPGLVAIIGNKGMGKTALAESVGLLGNSAQSASFSFLAPAKFKQLKENKASHFEAVVEWCDGHIAVRRLSDSIDVNAREAVSYIPQNYLETICNEIQMANSTFERELKSVIFSHVDDATRLGTESLDTLINFRTEQTHSRMNQIRSEMREINKKILELQKLGSAETKLTIEGLFSEKTRELEAHDRAKPVEVQKPETDLIKRQEMQAIADAIEEQQKQSGILAVELRRVEFNNRTAQLRKAVAERVLGRLRNFQLQYDDFLTEAKADCEEIGLKMTDLVKINFDSITPAAIKADAESTIELAATEKADIEARISDIKNRVSELTQKLDAPNIQYQTYLRELEGWKQRRELISGDREKAGTVSYLQAQLKDLEKIPTELENAKASREAKSRELYRELEQLVMCWLSLKWRRGAFR